MGICSVALSALALSTDGLHQAVPWTLWLLPVLALLSAYLYAKLDIPYDMSTASVIGLQRAGKPVPVKLALAVPIGMALTLAGGGSVGKTAAAMQMGGALASGLARVVGEKESCRALILCGAAAAFSALMFTPIAAVVFVLEIARMPKKHLLDPRMLCIPLASGISYAIALQFNVGRLWTPGLPVPALSDALWQTVLLGVACAAAGAAFVLLMKFLRTLSVAFVHSVYLRAAAGAAAVIAVTLLSGTSAYAGTGATLISEVLGGGSVPGWSFAWKIVLTALCLGVGLKGGAIMPSFCIGVCLGFSLGSLLGVSPEFMAAVGLVATFSACTRSPLAGAVLGIEAFGLAGAPYFLIATFLTLLTSRSCSLYENSNWMLPFSWARREADGTDALDGKGE